MAITLLNLIQGHRFWYQPKVHMLLVIRRRDVDVESVLAQAERLFASFSHFYYKLQYQIRLHLLLNPHYHSQFREFVLD